MNILKNFKFVDGNLDEFRAIKIIPTDEVFAELPICQVEFGASIKVPFLYAVAGQIPMAVEYDQLVKILKGTKLFHLKAIEGDRLVEVAPNEAIVHIRLPQDTNIADLVYIQGQVLKQEVID